MFECVVNVSEGRDPVLLAELARSCGPPLLDLHRDEHHHRAVFTLAGSEPEVAEAARSLSARAVELLDLTRHEGVHPRLGVVDVVPFVPFLPFRAPTEGRATASLFDPTLAVALRDHFATWAAWELGVPCFLYGPDTGPVPRTLPDIRRGAFTTLSPDLGPDRPHPTAGAMAVGARSLLVAYNVWVAGPPGQPATNGSAARGTAGDGLALVRQVAGAVRGEGVRALGFDVGGRLQVSCNLVDPFVLGPAQAYDAIAAELEARGASADGAELVGLLPEAVLGAVPRHRWAELGLAAGRTIEAGLEAQGTTTR